MGRVVSRFVEEEEGTSGMEDLVKKILQPNLNREREVKWAWPQCSRSPGYSKKTNLQNRRSWNKNKTQRKTIQWDYSRKSPDSKGRNGYPNTQEALRNLNRKRAENLSLPNHSKDVKDTKSETILEAVKEGAGEKTQWPGEIALWAREPKFKS